MTLKLLEEPVLALPPLPEYVKFQFARELDRALEERISALHDNATRPSPPPMTRPGQFSWPVTWLSGALIGFTTSWVIFSGRLPDGASTDRTEMTVAGTRVQLSPNQLTSDLDEFLVGESLPWEMDLEGGTVSSGIDEVVPSAQLSTMDGMSIRARSVNTGAPVPVPRALLPRPTGHALSSPDDPLPLR